MFRIDSFLFLFYIISLVSVQFSTSFIILRQKRGVTVVSDDSSAPGLFNQVSKIIVLNNTNFNKLIFEDHKDKLWLVDFYKNWCGYCVRFVSIMKAFASDIYDWRDAVKIGSVDCASSVNSDICRIHEINKVPAIRIFPPNSSEDFVGIEFGRGSETTITEMREKLAHVLKSYHNSQEKVIGPVNLKLVRNNGLDWLWNDTPVSVQYVMLVFEQKDSLVGSQVALDVSRTQELRVRLVDPRNRNLSRLVGMEEGESGVVILEKTSRTSANLQASSADTHVNELKTVNLYRHTTNKESLKLSSSAHLNDINRAHVAPLVFDRLLLESFTREGLNKAVRRFLVGRGVNIALELPNVTITHSNVSVSEIKKAIKREVELKQALNVKYLSTVVFKMDLEAAVVYSLSREVTMVKNFTTDQLQALRNFVAVIIKYFPIGVQGKRFFTELKKELDNKGFVTGEDFGNAFKELDVKYNPFMPNLEWVGCHGTIPSLRGYPCGLWTLFHTLVAFEELKDRNIPGEYPESLSAVAGYIKYFFSCSECAEHFNRMARTIAANVTSQRGAVMWLWRTHNDVNRRLAGDETEDPRHHKVQFPTSEACPICRTSHGSWDEDQVFLFISKMFTNIVELNPHDSPKSAINA